MSFLRIVLAICMLATLSWASESEGIFDCLTGPCVTVPGVGKLQGSKKSSQMTGRDIYGFWKIPYGETTGGENRFKPPVKKGPINNGDDAYDASYSSYILSWWNNVCPQPGIDLSLGYNLNPWFNMAEAEAPINMTDRASLSVLGTEDCLHLAVFTPELPSAERNPKLPVMVYIHGGAFMLGGYIGAGPGKLLEKDVVLVMMQYRLGPLGFMCLPDDEVAGNMGLMDQNLAMQWVQDNIIYFGGDPSQVTILGESAGAASVSYHMISPLSEPLFHQAIVESGSALSSWAFDSDPATHAMEVARATGCELSDISTLVNCLKFDKTITEIVTSHKEYYLAERAAGRLGFGGSSPCAQTHGHQKFITMHPKQYIMEGISGNIKRYIPTIFGANKHEGSFVLGLMYNSYIQPNAILEDNFFLRHLFISTIMGAMGLHDESGNIYEMLQYTFFNGSDLGTWEKMMDGMINLVGTFFIKASTFEFMKFHALSGSPSWFYSFEYYGESSLWNFLFPGSNQPPISRGVTHGDELIYLFSTGVFQLSDQDWDMAWKMVNLWTNFAIHGHPTPADHQIESIPNWETHNDDTMPFLVISENPKIGYNYISTWAFPDRSTDEL